jgi:hypothetical protein
MRHAGNDESRSKICFPRRQTDNAEAAVGALTPRVNLCRAHMPQARLYDRHFMTPDISRAR